MYEIDGYEKQGKLQLILSTSDDLTPEQRLEHRRLAHKMVYPEGKKTMVRYSDTAASLLWCFQNGFDCFNLIERGLAIRASQKIGSRRDPGDSDLWVVVTNIEYKTAMACDIQIGKRYKVRSILYKRPVKEKVVDYYLCEDPDNAPGTLKLYASEVAVLSPSGTPTDRTMIPEGSAQSTDHPEAYS